MDIEELDAVPVLRRGVEEEMPELVAEPVHHPHAAEFVVYENEINAVVNHISRVFDKRRTDYFDTMIDEEGEDVLFGRCPGAEERKRFPQPFIDLLHTIVGVNLLVLPSLRVATNLLLFLSFCVCREVGLVYIKAIRPLYNLAEAFGMAEKLLFLLFRIRAFEVSDQN